MLKAGHERFRSVVRVVSASLMASSFAPLATAQFNNQWVGFAQEPGRLSAASSLGATDTEEKDYAVGDLDRDGWVDLVCVRKEPFSTPGRRQNVLFMNERGVLTDRTAQFASASDVVGDQGFLTPTNDRDVQIVDVDLDGWLDVVTATTYGQGLPKEVSHPRVYRNLGLAPDGTWLGLVYQSARIPQLFNGASPTSPDFCSVSAGDVSGDGYPDLYFVDYGITNDRLLINDGNGFFTDETAMRMTSAMSASGFGTSGEVRDMNGDGLMDLVKNEAFSVSAIYQNPANAGNFHIQQSVYGGSGYHMTTGDLNRDGRLDVVVTDDGQDRYLYNTGTDALGRVVWGASKVFQFLTGGEDEFGGEAVVVDLDGDGWNDVLITDVDVDINNCFSSRLHIYHNPGGVVGGQITLREEAESASGGWRGAVGLLPADLHAMHDIAVFDIDNDGDLDLVFGRCGSTTVWMNTLACPSGTTIYCTAKTNSLNCTPEIGFYGVSSATANSGFEVNAHYVRNNKLGLLFYGTNGASNTPFQGGVKCVQSPVIRTPVIDSGGEAAPADDCTGVYRIDMAAFAAGLLGGNPLPALQIAGTTVHCQFWGRDPGFAPPNNTTLSDALTYVICP